MSKTETTGNGLTKTKLTPPPTSSNRYRKMSALEDGQSIIGTIVGFPTRYSEQLKKDMTSILMKNNTGEFEITPVGTAVDFLQAGALKIGSTYEFRKEGVTKTKKGGYKNNIGVYLIENKSSVASTDSDI